MKEKNPKCPNCGEESLIFISNEWVCTECEFHTKDLKKKTCGSFR
jgi:ribosomal protein S27AE